jgi:two-component system chemotaxis response regulator CheB
MAWPTGDVLAIGTCAGGVELPRDLPASVLVTIHLPSYLRSSLDEVLTKAGVLPGSSQDDCRADD